jgi:tetratricopeptide (TPR) repeat protein
MNYALDNKGDHDGAIAEYRKALALEPGLDLAHYGLGLALAATGRRKEAGGEFQKANRLNPGLKPPQN